MSPAQAQDQFEAATRVEPTSPRTPTWRLALRRTAGGVIGVWLILFGFDWSAILLHARPLPDALLTLALAAAAVSALAILVDVILHRVAVSSTRVVRCDIADLRERVDGLSVKHAQTVDRLTAAVVTLAEAVGERVDGEFLRGVQATLDDVGTGRAQVVPMHGNVVPQRQRNLS